MGEPKVHKDPLESGMLLCTIAKLVQTCSDCWLEHDCRGPVPADGNYHNPKLMIVGQSPGAQEDLQRKPFVGPSGKWVQTTILDPLGLTREDVYITNVIKCHPKGNHANLEEAFVSCSWYSRNEIAISTAPVVFLLGSWAWRVSPLAEQARSVLHKLVEHQGKMWVHAYHPSYLFRRASARRVVEAILEEETLPKIKEILKNP